MKRLAIAVFSVALVAAVCPAAYGQANKSRDIFKKCCPLAEDPQEALKEARARGCPVLVGVAKLC